MAMTAAANGPLSPDVVRALRAGAQLLHRPDSARSVAGLVRHLGGVQAQILSAAALALRARAAGVLAAEVEAARLEERSVVRTWALRGTLHLVPAEDVGWLRSVLAPALLPKGYRRLRQLGVDRADADRAVGLIRESLARDGPLTRAEIAERLAPQGITTRGQAAAHLVWLAAMRGVSCMGPDRGRDPTFVLMQDWAGPQRKLNPPDALAELARRHLVAYGPVTPQDFAAWAGLPLRDARAGWGAQAEDLIEVEVEGEGSRQWLLCSQGREPAPRDLVRLIPTLDPYLLGYRSRDLAVPRRYARLVNRGGGFVRPAALVGGTAVAVWSMDRRAAGLIVSIQPFADLPPALLPGLQAEVADLGRFLGTGADLVLAERDAGGP